MNIKDLQPMDVIDVYVRTSREWGTGIVVRTYVSGGAPGARIAGVLPDHTVFDTHIKNNSDIGRLLHRGEGKEK